MLQGDVQLASNSREPKAGCASIVEILASCQQRRDVTGEAMTIGILRTLIIDGETTHEPTKAPKKWRPFSRSTFEP